MNKKIVGGLSKQSLNASQNEKQELGQLSMLDPNVLLNTLRNLELPDVCRFLMVKKKDQIYKQISDKNYATKKEAAGYFLSLIHI